MTPPTVWTMVESLRIPLTVPESVETVEASAFPLSAVARPVTWEIATAPSSLATAPTSAAVRVTLPSWPLTLVTLFNLSQLLNWLGSVEVRP